MRTNIDIDDRVMAELLKRTGLRTKRDVVALALNTLLRREKQKDILQLQGTGWEGDLDKMRRDA